MRIAVILLFLTFSSIAVNAQVLTNEVETKAKSLLNQMTLKEKLDYIGGYNGFYIRPITRLGIPEIRMADGPQGVRNETKSTLYPCGIALTSTFNRQLMHKMGEGLGLDCRARGVHILLGPGVNIYRSPLCGRNFEYFGEDSYLASETAVQYIQGVQSKQVIATVKHYAGNNQEYDRHHVSSDIDKRTLNEVYLPTFRKAVEQANVGAVMNSYNLVNGVHATENKYLNIDLLRNTWDFKGILMSDWTSVYSAVGPANGGLDLEMPYGKYMNYENLSKAIDNGLVSVKTIDDKVLNILRTLIAYNFLNRPQKDETIPEKNPYTEDIALQIAREGIVLLKNENNVLPLKGKTLVTGPNTTTIPTGGGSGNVYPFTVVSMYNGLKNLPTSANYIFEITQPTSSKLSEFNEFITEKGSKKTGFKSEYFKNELLKGSPDFTGIDNALDFDWGLGKPFTDFPNDKFSARWRSVFKPKFSGKYILKILADDGYRMIFNGKEMFSDWSQHAVTGKETVVTVEAGKEYPVIIEYYEEIGGASMKFEYARLLEEKLDSKLKRVQNVILCVGFNHKLEFEDADRPFELPQYQLDLIDRMSKEKKNVIVIVNAGGGVEMASWKDKVQGIIMAWYPGQQGGQALAEIVSGKISPSGKLPISIEKKAEDNPTFGSYFDVNPKSVHKRVQYNEGVFLGYKGYDKSGIEPLFPFGAGLSYTNFEYSNLKVAKTGENKVIVTYTIKNIGKYDASEISQVYVGDVTASVPRPQKELKGFDKVFLKKGESKEIRIELKEDAFAFFDVNTDKFIVEPGEFKILVGASAKDIRLNQTVVL